MVNGKLHIDDDGYPRAEFDPPNEELGDYLEEDIQSSPEACDYMSSACDDVSYGKISEWDDVGNAYRLTIRDGRVRIANEYSDFYEPCVISVDEYKQVLRIWKELVTKKEKGAVLSIRIQDPN